MQLRKEISKRKESFVELCKKHGVQFLYGFGSSVTGKFDKNVSDIDLLVEIDEKDPIKRGNKLLSLWDSFEVFFKTKVDLLTESSIRNPYFKKVLMPKKFSFMKERDPKYLSDILQAIELIEDFTKSIKNLMITLEI